MTIFYNEWDDSAASWVENLIKRGALPAGVVSRKSITDLCPKEVQSFGQSHFFAGIGGWPYALELAGYGETQGIWTGSPPCQPFSSAGKQRGKEDERHLAPVWLRLIRECKPPIVFGEQVEAAIRQGWLDDLFNELEAQGYSCGAAVLPACSAGAPHLRKRLFFGAIRLEDAQYILLQGTRSRLHNCGMADTHRIRQQQEQDVRPPYIQLKRPKEAKLWNESSYNSPSVYDLENTEGRLSSKGESSMGISVTHKDHGGWKNTDWIGCRDGKLRPVEPGTFPLDNGVSSRVGRLRGYGNAIVPQVAAGFIQAFMDAARDTIAHSEIS